MIKLISHLHARDGSGVIEIFYIFGHTNYILIKDYLDIEL